MAELAENGKHPTATYRVLMLVNEGNNAASIARALGVSRSSISKRIAKLIRGGLIVEGIRSSFGKELILTPNGKFIFKELQQVLKGLNMETLGTKEFKVIFRRHHVILRLPILYRQPDIEAVFQRKGATYKRRGPVLGWEVLIEDQPVMLTGKSILIFPKPITGTSVFDCVKKSFELMEVIKDKLRTYAPYLVLAEKSEICRQHLAMVGGFTELIPKGFKYQSDRLVIDYSTGVAELEGINSRFAVEDMQVLMQHFEAIVRNEFVKPK